MAPRAQTVAISSSRRPLSERVDSAVKHIGLAKLSLCYVMTASAFTAYLAGKPVLESTVLEMILCLFLLCQRCSPNRLRGLFSFRFLRRLSGLF